MKKILISLFFSVLYITSSSADFGVNLGVSGQAGIFTASGQEKNPTSSTTTGTGSEHGSAGWGSIFLEGTLNDKFLFGIDYVPMALETDTVETQKTEGFTRGDDGTNTTANAFGQNKIQVDFEDLTTLYAGYMINENFYVKAGITKVEIITNESLATGSKYGDKSMDGSMFGLGYHVAKDNGVFFRFEGNYMSFDGASAVSQTNADRKIELDNLDGVTGKLSIGKTF
ncbi:hypothetical protein OAN11_02040 [Candidatus Pelagibacter sp.]|nr:hypothetical protein [Candidatus Pelagibacter sp.]